MVDFTTPDLPGASAEYNAIAKKVKEVEDSVMSKLDAAASDLKAAMETDLIDLKAKTKVMIPELPTAAALNLQSEITSLASLTAGTDAYNTKLSSIGTSFGSAITAGGYDLNKIATDGAAALAGATESLAAAIPNMELASGAAEAIEVARASLQPAIDALKETAQEFSEDLSEDDDLGIYGDAYSRNTLADTMKSLAEKAKAFAEAFEARQNRKIQESATVEI